MEEKIAAEAEMVATAGGGTPWVHPRGQHRRLRELARLHLELQMPKAPCEAAPENVT